MNLALRSAPSAAASATSGAPRRSPAPRVETRQTTLGDLISLFYDEFMEQYGDPELASVAAAAVINDLLSREASESASMEAAA
jgi:hypothetical protein